MAGKDGKDEFFHKLAVDERGIGFPLPRDAVAWRIQRMPPGRGRPMPLYKAGDGEEGPLEIKIETPSWEHVKDAIRSSSVGMQGGRYRMVPVDNVGEHVGKQFAYTPPFEAESDAAPPDEEDSIAGPCTTNHVLMAFAKRITERDIERDANLIKAVEKSAALAEKALHVLGETNIKQTETLGRSQCDLIKGYAQVRPVTVDELLEEASAAAAGGGGDDKEFLERLMTSAPQWMQVFKMWQEMQASSRANKATEAAAAVAASTVTVEPSPNGTNGVHVGIKPPSGNNGTNGQGA